MNEELTKKCEEIRKNLIEVVSKNGGHLGPNLGVVELTVCLDEVFDFKEDIVLFDVGHQAYVYKILTDRAEEKDFHLFLIQMKVVMIILYRDMQVQHFQ